MTNLDITIGYNRVTNFLEHHSCCWARRKDFNENDTDVATRVVTIAEVGRLGSCWCAISCCGDGVTDGRRCSVAGSSGQEADLGSLWWDLTALPEIIIWSSTGKVGAGTSRRRHGPVAVAVTARRATAGRVEQAPVHQNKSQDRPRAATKLSIC